MEHGKVVVFRNFRKEIQILFAHRSLYLKAPTLFHQTLWLLPDFESHETGTYQFWAKALLILNITEDDLISNFQNLSSHQWIQFLIQIHLAP